MASGPAPHKSAPTKAALAKAAAAKSQAALIAKAQAARSAKLAALKTARGPEPAWVKANGLSTSLDGDNLVYTKNIQQGGETYLLKYDTSGNYVGETHTGFDFNPLALIGGLALSFFLPGVGAAITESLVGAGVMSAGFTADAVGLAIANTAAGVAQGQPLDKALTNAVVGAAVSTGSIEVAKVVNGIISSPAITDAIVSAGASAVKSAAAGGSEEDAAKAALAGLVGSGTTSAVKNVINTSPEIANIVGSAAGGAVTGGTTGAVTGALNTAAGQLGKTTPVVSTPPADLKAAFETGQISALGSPNEFGVWSMPDGTYRDQFNNMVDNRGNPIQGQPFRIDVAGGPLPEETGVGASNVKSTGTLGAPILEEPTTATTTYQPNISIVDSISSPKASTDSKILELIKPTISTTFGGDISTTGTGASSGAGTNTAGGGTVGGVVSGDTVTKTTDTTLPDVTVTGKKEEPIALEPVTITGKKEQPTSVTTQEPIALEPVTVTGKAEEPVVVTEEPPLDVAVEEPPPEEKPPEEKPYKPNLFILGGTKPKPPPSKTPTSVLSQALGTTTGLTASRGAGEIEDPSTGKKKRKVWNEETLRLKDALGV